MKNTVKSGIYTVGKSHFLTRQTKRINTIMIGKTITYYEYFGNSKIENKGIILDKVFVPEIIYKEDHYECLKRGYNYGDGKNQLGAVSVTKYLVKIDSSEKPVLITPERIIAIHD